MNRPNVGHLIEASLAHQDLDNNDRLLESIQGFLDLICNISGPGGYQIPA